MDTLSRVHKAQCCSSHYPGVWSTKRRCSPPVLSYFRQNRLGMNTSNFIFFWSRLIHPLVWGTVSDAFVNSCWKVIWRCDYSRSKVTYYRISREKINLMYQQLTHSFNGGRWVSNIPFLMILTPLKCIATKYFLKTLGYKLNSEETRVNSFTTHNVYCSAIIE